MEADRLSGGSGRSRRDAHRGFPGYEGAVQGSLPGSRSLGFRLAPKKHWRPVTGPSVWPVGVNEKDPVLAFRALVADRAVPKQPAQDYRPQERKRIEQHRRDGDQPSDRQELGVVVMNRMEVVLPCALWTDVVPGIFGNRRRVFVAYDFDVHMCPPIQMYSRSIGEARR